MFINPEFFYGKKVFVTGHTGFKGSWLCRVLVGLGAKVTGYSLPAPTEPNLYSMADLDKNIDSVVGDIRDLKILKEAFDCIWQLNQLFETHIKILTIHMNLM